MTTLTEDKPKTDTNPYVSKPSSLRTEEFDAVIEGTVATRRDPRWNELAFHREKLYLPRDIGTIVSGHRRLPMHGYTRDFFTIHQTPAKGNSHYPVALVGAEWPRSIIMSSGQIYVAYDLKSDAEYLKKLPEIVAMAGAYFSSGNFGN